MWEAERELWKCETQGRYWGNVGHREEIIEMWETERKLGNMGNREETGEM